MKDFNAEIRYPQSEIRYPGALPDRIVFAADVHLGLSGEGPERAERFAAFIRGLTGIASHLYILGDLFDFWFEYRTVVPNTAPAVIAELHRLVRSGTRVVLLAGNHDYWFGPYLRDGIGIEVHPGSLTVEHQGLRLFLHHGDGLYPGDHGYRILKKILRNRFFVALFRLIHPDLGERIARLSSSTSRKYLAPPPGRDEVYAALFRDIADRKLGEGFDAAVYGHSHVPLLEERPAGTLLLLGDWISHATYAMLEGGVYTLHEWHADGGI